MENLAKLNQYLCPPGNGVYTVHTAKENKEKLYSILFGSKQIEVVKKKWSEQLSHYQSVKSPILLGICSDTGGGIQRGANWGPLFIREYIQNSLNPPEYFDIGDIRVIPHLLHDKYLNDETIKSCQEALYDGENLKVSSLSIAEDVADILFNEQKRLFSLGGDHSVSYPLVKSWLNAKKDKRVAIIHFDAHTDLMDKRLGIDICFGSWAYHMIELLDKPSDIIQFGIRSSGQDRNHWENKLGVQQFWADEIKNNFDSVLSSTLNYLREEKIEEVYISFDIDALDATYASATGTPEHGGLEPHTCIDLIDKISKVCKVTAGDLVEVAPFVRSVTESKIAPEPESTLQSASLISQKIIEVMSE